MEILEKLLDLSNVDQYKEYLIKKIDNKTSSQILSGFDFEGKHFSMSYSAQINWSNLPSLPDIVFPLTISSTDESIYILELVNKMNFYLTVVSFKNGILQNGTVLKQSVINSLTIEELQIIDNSL